MFRKPCRNKLMYNDESGAWERGKRPYLSSYGGINSHIPFWCNQIGSAFLAMNSSTGTLSICGGRGTRFGIVATRLGLGRELGVPGPQRLLGNAHRLGRRPKRITFLDDQPHDVLLELVRIASTLGRNLLGGYFLIRSVPNRTT